MAELGHGSKPRNKVPHAIWGAAFAYRFLGARGGDRWKELAFPIKGHHAGLPNGETTSGPLEEFSSTHPDALPTMQAMVAALLKQVDKAPSLRFPEMTHTQRELFVRMLLSALVDADRLATASPDRSWQSLVHGSGPTIGALWAKVDASRPRAAKQSAKVRRVREEVYEACVAAAPLSPGLFRLTVPTGGGKTRSSLAFALKHALDNELRGVIFSLPYTSIIDQTAKEYRAIFGDEAVLEHHSALDLPD